MKDLLTSEEKDRLEKDGITIVSGEPEMPLPSEFKKEYDGYHVMYRMVGSTIVKDARGKEVYLGCPPGRALVAIASPEHKDELFELVKRCPGYISRRFIHGIIEFNPGPYVATIQVCAPRL